LREYHCATVESIAKTESMAERANCSSGAFGRSEGTEKSSDRSFALSGCKAAGPWLSSGPTSEQGVCPCFSPDRRGRPTPRSLFRFHQFPVFRPVGEIVNVLECPDMPHGVDADAADPGDDILRRHHFKGGIVPGFPRFDCTGFMPCDSLHDEERLSAMSPVFRLVRLPPTMTIYSHWSPNFFTAHELTPLAPETS